MSSLDVDFLIQKHSCYKKVNWYIYIWKIVMSTDKYLNQTYTVQQLLGIYFVWIYILVYTFNITSHSTHLVSYLYLFRFIQITDKNSTSNQLFHYLEHVSIYYQIPYNFAPSHRNLVKRNNMSTSQFLIPASKPISQWCQLPIQI